MHAILKKNLTTLFISCSICISAQTNEKIWTTINSTGDIPEWKDDKLHSTNPEVQQLIDAYDITSVERVVPTTSKESLKKVVELTCDCVADELSLAIEKTNAFSNPHDAPRYELLYEPDDYTMSFQVDYALDLIDAKEAWNYSTGLETTIIGVSDANYYDTHEELETKIEYLDPTNNNANYYHGTAVAITTAGKTNNGVGKSSIGHDCKLWLTTMTYNNLLLMSQSGIRVINVSWASGCIPNPYVEDIVEEIYANGSIMVAAAGNGSTCGGPTSLVFPAAFEHVISVTSVGEYDNHEKIPGDPSSTHQHNSTVDICAPGYDVPLSIAPNYYNTSNGTSFAAPFVTGTIGLMLSINSCLTFEDVREILKLSSDNIEQLNPNYANMLGFGRLNAGEALKIAQNFVCNSAQASPTNNTLQHADKETELAQNSENELSTSINSESFSVEMGIHPNPSKGASVLYYDIYGQMELNILDVTGAIVQTHRLTPDKNYFEFNLTKNGVYIIIITENNEPVWMDRFIKM